MKNQSLQLIVLDGLGGGIGKSIVEKLREEIPPLHIIAAGTNPVALKRMIDAGANEGITGENNIIQSIHDSNIIIGAMGILIPGGLLGEISSPIVLAICDSPSTKILIPMDKCGIRIATEQMPLNHYISYAVETVKSMLK